MKLTGEFELDGSARDYGAEVLDQFAVELIRESRRIAARAEATTVSESYVRQAALNLKLARPAGTLADFLSSTGMAILAAAAGVLATLQTASVDAPGWVDALAVAAVILGSATFAVGITLSLTNRRR